MKIDVQVVWGCNSWKTEVLEVTWVLRNVVETAGQGETNTVIATEHAFYWLHGLRY